MNGVLYDVDSQSSLEEFPSRYSAHQQMEMEALLLSKEFRERTKDTNTMISTEMMSECQVLEY